MGTGIKVKNTRNITFENVKISGFDTGISTENSNIDIINSDLSHNKIGLESLNSDSRIYNSTFQDNDIDIVATNSSIETIDTIVRNVIIKEMDEMIRNGADVNTNPFEVKKLASKVLKSNKTYKREEFKKLLKQIQIYASYGTQFYSLLKLVLAPFGIQLP